MVDYVTKDDIATDLTDIILNGESFEGSSMPLLAFDNEEETLGCPHCEKTDQLNFQYNVASSAGFDQVIFDWNVDLERLYLTGHFCKFCGEAEVYLHEQSPENEGELILDQDSNQ